MTSPIIDFLEARLAEDEAVARAAIDPDRPGTHWQWVNDETDEPIGDLDAESAVGGLSLRTVEKFVRGEAIGSYEPSPLPAFVIYTAEEIIPGAGDHIARHDPARALCEVQAKRRILKEHSTPHTVVDGFCTECGSDLHDGVHKRDRSYCEIHGWRECETVLALAAIYSDHSEFRKEWAA